MSDHEVHQNEQEERHLEFEELFNEEQDAFSSNTNEEEAAWATNTCEEHEEESVQLQKRRPSVRRNRDHSKKTTWTYELNKALYDCHLKADKSIYGYRGQIKVLWDETQPNYSHMGSNHLATQAKRIIDKELIAETKRTVPEKNDDKVTEDTNDRDRNESIRADEQVPQEQPTTTKQKTNEIRTARTDKHNPKLDEGHHPHDKRVNEEELSRIVDEIRPEWIRNYEKFLSIEIEDRLYLG